MRLFVAPGLPVLLEGGEQHVRAIGTLASLSSWSREGLPFLLGDASVPTPHNPSPAPTGTKGLPRRRHNIPTLESSIPASTERPHPSSFFLAFFLHLTVIGRNDEFEQNKSGSGTSPEGR